MSKNMRATAFGVTIVLFSWICVAQPVTMPDVKIGVLTDMGSVFSDFGGPGSVIAAQMAVQDSGMADKVQLIAADHQNKPDIGAGLARAWFEQQRGGRHLRRADVLRRVSHQHGGRGRTRS